ncbi:Gp37-like protein [Dielma fastidiosa]|uniref:Gp37-like protein n=1 Tax=Dielma fastidiosa TaxID=1034346 RepID=UPI0015FD3FD8|nr:hypothetical protein [Dielma fastidiosa]
MEIIAAYLSLEYVLKHRGAGTFTLTLNDGDVARSFFQNDILMIDDDAFIVENIHVFSDDGANTYEISGLHINSLLSRRVISSFTFDVNETYEMQIEKLLNENFITPSDTDRKIDGFVFSTQGIETAPTVEYTLENLEVAEAVNTALSRAELGYTIDYFPEDEHYSFRLMQGADKTDDVIFSDKNNNIANKDVYQQQQDCKNVGYLNNEGVLTSKGAAAGINRREFILDGSEETALDEQLADSKPLISAEFEVIDNELYQYGRDYKLGDIVTFEDYDSNLTAQRPLLEVAFYCTDTITRTTTFGDSIPTIFDKLKKGR